MSKTFSTRISTVMKTVIVVPLICGTTTFQKICHSEAPSMRAASMVSSGTPLIADDIRIIPNPAWSQIRITISRNVLSLNDSLWSQVCGSPPSVVQTALSRPVWVAPVEKS